MSVTEPNVAVNSGIVKQTEGSRLSLSRMSAPSVISLVVLVGYTAISLQ